MFETFLVKPLYNGFVFLIGIVPQGDVGLAIILLTLIVRAVFYPAFAASIRTQIGMQAVQPELDKINEQYKDKPEERARRTMALFKENKIRPFAGLLSLFIQIPIFIALYFAFFREGLPNIDTTLLYSFVPVPSEVTVYFLGLVNLLATYNLVLALLVGGLQYLVARFSMARTTPSPHASPERQMAHRLQRRMMLFFLPAIIGGLTFTFPAGVGIYFAAGNVITLGQEWLLRRQKKA